MSISSVESAISQVRSEISEIQSEINRLNNEITAIGISASAATTKLINTRNDVENCMVNSRDALTYANAAIDRTRIIQLDLRELYLIFKEMETANKNIYQLNNRLFFEFGTYSKVRKIVRGFMDNLNFDMVSTEMIYKTLEKQHLQTPDYWLTCALLAVMFWKEDNKEKANQAIQEAIKLNDKMTYIFFMLFNIKIKRFKPALKWFECYKQCEKIGKDNDTFLMLLSAIDVRINNEDALDESTSAFVEYVKEQVTKDKDAADSDTLINIIANYFSRLDVAEAMNYPNIRRYIPRASYMAESLSKAKNNQAILEFVEDKNKVHRDEINRYADKYIDEMIDVPSEPEREIREQIEYNEMIIAAVDELKATDEKTHLSVQEFRDYAMTKVREKVEHDNSVMNTDLELVNWVFVKNNIYVNSLTNWNMFALINDYVKTGYDVYVNNYRKMHLSNYDVVINDFTFNTRFKNLDADINTKNRFMEQKLRNRLKTVKNIGAILMFVFGGLSIIGGILLAFVFQTPVSPFLGYVLLAVGLILILCGVVNLVSNASKRKKIIKNTEDERIKLDGIIKDLYDEMKQYNQEYDDADKISNIVVDKLNTIWAGTKESTVEESATSEEIKVA